VFGIRIRLRNADRMFLIAHCTVVPLGFQSGNVGPGKYVHVDTNYAS
jgi:hypothetical protein